MLLLNFSTVLVCAVGLYLAGLATPTVWRLWRRKKKQRKDDDRL